MKKLILIGVLVSVLFTSCTKKFEEINTDPNNPSDTPTTNLLTGIIKTTVYNTQFDIGYEMAGLWSQNVSRVQFADFNNFAFDNAEFDSEWSNMYSSIVNINLLIEKAKAEGNSVSEGAALILRAYNGQVIADLWGDAPWTEATNAFSETPNFTPKYDLAEDIYRSIIQDVEDGLVALGLGTGELGAGDVLYDGNTDKWAKFGNALLARILTRVSGTPLADPTKLADALNGNIISSNADNASLSYDNDQSTSVNPIFVALLSRKDIANSKQMIDMLSARDDARISMYAEMVDTSAAGIGKFAYVGHQNGGENAPGTSGPGTISDIALSYQDNPSSPLHLLTYAEVEFLRAEYENSQGNAPDAEAAYENGITASHEQYEVTLPSNYLTNALVKISGSYPAEQAIAEQKFLALWLQGTETYSEYRRTGFPVLTVGSMANQSTVPTKFPYPNTEIQLNSENVVNSSLTEFNNKVFWDLD